MCTGLNLRCVHRAVRLRVWQFLTLPMRTHELDPTRATCAAGVCVCVFPRGASVLTYLHSLCGNACLIIWHRLCWARHPCVTCNVWYHRRCCLRLVMQVSSVSICLFEVVCFGCNVRCVTLPLPVEIHIIRPSRPPWCVCRQ